MIYNVKIESNIPIMHPLQSNGSLPPGHAHAFYRECALKMNLGDSILFDTRYKATLVHEQLKRMHGKRASVIRKDGSGYRVWRRP